MKLCSNCREAVDNNVPFCDHCGAKQPDGRTARAAAPDVPDTRVFDVSVPDTPGSRFLRLLLIVVLSITVLVIAFNAYMIILGR